MKELKLKDLIIKSEAELSLMTDEQLLKLKATNESITAENSAIMQEFILKSVQEAEELKKALKLQGEELTSLKDNKVVSLKKELKLKEEAILKGITSYKEKGLGKFNLDLKTVTSSSISGSTASQRIAGVGHEPVRRIFISSLFNNVIMSEGYNGGSISYVEQNVLTRNADNVADCTAFPESDITWIERKADIKKIADSIKVCKDALENYSFMEAEVNSFINENMGLKLDQQLLYGTGVGNQLAGVISYAQTWSAGAFATSIKTATILDVIATGITQVQNSGQNNFFNVNAILMNPTDVRKMGLEKDANGQYLLPNYLTNNGISIEGIPVISTPLVVANTLFIMDSSKASIYTLRELEMEMANQHDTDFTSDLLTLKASLRKALVVKNQDKNAFLHCTDIASAKVALTAV